MPGTFANCHLSYIHDLPGTVLYIVVVFCQLLVSDLNRHLTSRCLSPHDFAIIGVSWTDLYPSPRKNFVLGQAAGDILAATVSFGRFETNPREPRSQPEFIDVITRVDGELLWKMMKVGARGPCSLVLPSQLSFPPSRRINDAPLTRQFTIV